MSAVGCEKVLDTPEGGDSQRIEEGNEEMGITKNIEEVNIKEECEEMKKEGEEKEKEKKEGEEKVEKEENQTHRWADMCDDNDSPDNEGEDEMEDHSFQNKQSYYTPPKGDDRGYYCNEVLLQNLSIHTTKEDILKMFSGLKIKRINISHKKTKYPHAYVEFETTEDMMKSIELNEKVIAAGNTQENGPVTITINKDRPKNFSMSKSQGKHKKIVHRNMDALFSCLRSNNNTNNNANNNNTNNMNYMSNQSMNNNYNTGNNNNNMYNMNSSLYNDGKNMKGAMNSPHRHQNQNYGFNNKMNYSNNQQGNQMYMNQHMNHMNDNKGNAYSFKNMNYQSGNNTNISRTTSGLGTNNAMQMNANVDKNNNTQQVVRKDREKLLLKKRTVPLNQNAYVTNRSIYGGAKPVDTTPEQILGEKEKEREIEREREREREREKKEREEEKEKEERNFSVLKSNTYGKDKNGNNLQRSSGSFKKGGMGYRNFNHGGNYQGKNSSSRKSIGLNKGGSNYSSKRNINDTDSNITMHRNMMGGGGGNNSNMNTSIAEGNTIKTNSNWKYKNNVDTSGQPGSTVASVSGGSPLKSSVIGEGGGMPMKQKFDFSIIHNYLDVDKNLKDTKRPGMENREVIKNQPPPLSQHQHQQQQQQQQPFSEEGMNMHEMKRTYENENEKREGKRINHKDSWFKREYEEGNIRNNNNNNNNNNMTNIKREQPVGQYGTYQEGGNAGMYCGNRYGNSRTRQTISNVDVSDRMKREVEPRDQGNNRERSDKNWGRNMEDGKGGMNRNNEKKGEYTHKNNEHNIDVSIDNLYDNSLKYVRNDNNMSKTKKATTVKGVKVIATDRKIEEEREKEGSGDETEEKNGGEFGNALDANGGSHGISNGVYETNEKGEKEEKEMERKTQEAKGEEAEENSDEYTLVSESSEEESNEKEQNNTDIIQTNLKSTLLHLKTKKKVKRKHGGEDQEKGTEGEQGNDKNESGDLNKESEPSKSQKIGILTKPIVKEGENIWKARTHMLTDAKGEKNDKKEREDTEEDKDNNSGSRDYNSKGKENCSNRGEEESDRSRNHNGRRREFRKKDGERDSVRRGRRDDRENSFEYRKNRSGEKHGSNSRRNIYERNRSGRFYADKKGYDNKSYNSDQKWKHKDSYDKGNYKDYYDNNKGQHRSSNEGKGIYDNKGNDKDSIEKQRDNNYDNRTNCDYEKGDSGKYASSNYSARHKSFKGSHNNSNHKLNTYSYSTNYKYSNYNSNNSINKYGNKGSFYKEGGKGSKYLDKEKSESKNEITAIPKKAIVQPVKNNNVSLSKNRFECLEDEDESDK